MRTSTVVLLLLCTSGWALADMLPLPVDMPLEAALVETDLRDDSLEVIIDDEAEPSLQVFDAVSGETSAGFVSLETDDTGTLRVMRPHGDALTAPPLRIRIVLNSSQGLRMRGTGFDASVTAPFVEEDDPPVPRGDMLYEVNADDARVLFRGVAGIDLRGEGSTYQLSLTASPLEAHLEAGYLEVEDHVGDARLRGRDADFLLALTRGMIQAGLDGGLLELREGAGSVDATINEGTLRTESWQGGVTLKGESTLVEVMNSGLEDSLLDLTGTQLSLAVEEFKGGLIADLEGGDMRLKNVGQRLQLTARDARAEIEGVGGNTRLRLYDRAVATVRGAVGKLEGQVEDSELNAGGRDLDVKLTRSVAELSSEQGRVLVKAVDSDVALKMESQQGYMPSFDLVGSSRVSVSMREPCAIVLRGDESMADMIEAGGCDLRVSGRRATSRRAPGPTTLVRAKVAPGALLEINSR